MSKLEDQLADQLPLYRVPPFVRNFQFNKKSATPVINPMNDKPFAWRFDFAWVEYKLAIEVEGGSFAGKCKSCGGRGQYYSTRFGGNYPCGSCNGTGLAAGAHVRGAHFESDCFKYAEAALQGWIVIRVTSDMVNDGRAANYARRYFLQKGVIR